MTLLLADEIYGSDWSWLAAFALPIREDVGLGLGVVLLCLGMGLHWRLPRQRMAVEEEMKDGTLTEAQAVRRMRVMAILAPTATVAGILLLLSVLLAYAK